MRKVHIDVLCDWHFRVQDEEVEAIREHEIKIDNRKTKTVGVCQDCFDDWFQHLEAALEQAQVADDAPKKQRTSVDSGTECPWPDCDRVGSNGFLSNRGLGQHMAAVHGTPWSQWIQMTEAQRRSTVRAA